MITLLNQVCTMLLPGVTSGTADTYGVVPTTTVTQGYRCRFVPAGTEVVTDAGRRVTVNPTLYLPKFATVVTGYKVTVSGTTYRIKGVNEGRDGAGRLLFYLCDLEDSK